MSPTQPARRTRSTLVATLVVLSLTMIGVFLFQSMGASSSSPPSLLPSWTTSVPWSSSAPSSTESPRTDRESDDGPVGKKDGVVPEGVTVVEAGVPAVDKLDPDLLSALRRAAADAAGDGIELFVNSGWRSPRYQEQLLSEAVAKYGSKAKASQWVATPEASPHVSGDAVDIGPPKAAKWLSKHGAQYGLCQIYRNEPWHYELRPTATDGCPAKYDDPTDDPRMQQ